MRSRAVFFFLVALASSAGCAAVLGFDDTTLKTDETLPDGAIVTADGAIVDSDGSVIGSDAAASRLTATPSSILLRRGGNAEVTVGIQRGADVTGTVTLRLANLPAGVTATTATLNAPASSGTITLKATAAAALGPKSVDLLADGTSLPSAPVALTVADPAGTPDTTFDTDGFVSDQAPGVATTFYALALAADGRILAGGAGGATAGALDGWVLRRYAIGGGAEGPFAAASTVALPANGELHALAVDAAGKILCVGTAPPMPAAPGQLTVVRLLATGAVDGTFGTAGFFRLPATESALGSTGLGLAVQADGSVVVVGSRHTAAVTDDGIIVRLKANGSRDPAFNAGATVVVPTSRLVGVSVEPSGAVIAGGSALGDPASYLLVKRTAAGAPDATFGTAGTATFGNTYSANGFARLGTSFALVGTASGAAAYTAGSAGVNGAAIFSRALAVAPGAGFFAAAAQDDKRFIAAGHTAVANGEARVERINDTGVRDTTFGTAGVAVLESGGAANGVDVTLFAAAVQNDGRILVAGNRSTSGGVVYRLWQ